MSEAAWIALDPAAEVLLEQSRARRRQRLHGRERLVKWASVCAFGAAVAGLAAAAPPAALPSMLLFAALVGAYAIAAQVEFEVGNGSAVPTQIVLVPMLFALPPALVPLAVAAGFLLGEIPALMRGRSTGSGLQQLFSTRGTLSAPPPFSRSQAHRSRAWMRCPSSPSHSPPSSRSSS